MKSFVISCLSIAVVIGGSANAAFSCGGSMGGTGCRLATLPLTFALVVSVIRWLGLVIP